MNRTTLALPFALVCLPTVTKTEVYCVLLQLYYCNLKRKKEIKRLRELHLKDYESFRLKMFEAALNYKNSNVSDESKELYRIYIARKKEFDLFKDKVGLSKLEEEYLPYRSEYLKQLKFSGRNKLLREFQKARMNYESFKNSIKIHEASGDS